MINVVLRWGEVGSATFWMSGKRLVCLMLGTCIFVSLSHFDMFVHVCVVSCSLEILWKDCWGFSFCKHLPGLTWLDKFKVWCYDVLYGKSLISCIIHPVVLSIVWQMASFNCRAHEEQTKAFQNMICCAYWLLYVIAQKFGKVYLNYLNEYSMTLCTVSNMPIYANYMLESGYTTHVMTGRTCHSLCVTRRILPVQIGGGQEGPKVKPTLLLLRQIYVQGLKDTNKL